MLPAHPSTPFDRPVQGSISHSVSSIRNQFISSPNSSSQMFRQPLRNDTMQPSSGYNGQLPHADNTMAPPEKPRDAPRKIDISTLMSPPEHALDSFSKTAPQSNYLTAHPAINNGVDARVVTERKDGRQPLPMSPPISPYSQHVAPAPSDQLTTIASHNQSVKDPVLYPQDDTRSSTSPSHSPLFVPVELERQQIIDDHIRNRSPTTFSNGASPPRREDYELVLTFKTQVNKLYAQNPKAWLRRERALLREQYAHSSKRFAKLLPATTKPSDGKALGKVNRGDRVSKPSAPRSIRANGNGNVNGAAKAHRRTSSTPDFKDPHRTKVVRVDKNWESIPDLCPPLSSLPNKHNSLKVDWKGQSIDLSDDPLAKRLHPDELLLAGILRLDCATYLASKRRFFIGRFLCIGEKEFRKTDAQKACKIDVNKASKLWVAFEKVGWLDKRWMERFEPRRDELTELYGDEKDKRKRKEKEI